MNSAAASLPLFFVSAHPCAAEHTLHNGAVFIRQTDDDRLPAGRDMTEGQANVNKENFTKILTKKSKFSKKANKTLSLQKNFPCRRKMITAALPYANGPVHIGHLAGVYIPADVYARFQRRSGSDVAFICGSDEHGIPITIRAKKKGLPQDIVDKYHTIIKKSFLKT